MLLFSGLIENLNACRGGGAVVKKNPLSKGIYGMGGDFAFDGGNVSLIDAIAGMREAVGKIAVVG